MANEPAFVRAQNLAPWHWKRERAPKHQNLGPSDQRSVNSSQLGPLLVDGKPSLYVANHSLESAKREQEPLTGTPEVIGHLESPTLEDGK